MAYLNAGVVMVILDTGVFEIVRYRYCVRSRHDDVIK